MASKDFTSNQIRVTKIIASGGLAGGGVPSGNNVGLVIYSASNSSDYAGGIKDNTMLDKVGKDTFLFVSGNTGNKGLVAGTVSLFGGDLVVSGNTHLHNELGVDTNKKIYFNSIGGDQHIYGNGSQVFLDGDDEVNLIADTSIDLTAQVNEFKMDSTRTVFNVQNEDKDFSVNTDDYYGTLFVDGNDNSIILGAQNFDSTPAASELVSKGYGADVKIMLSGTAGSQGTSTRGVVLVPGDMVISGTLHGGSPLKVNGGINLTGILSASQGLTGSLTKLGDGTSYLIAGAGIGITTGSSGAVTITNDGTVGDITGVTAGTGLTGGGTSATVTLNIDNSVVATLTGSQFSGNIGVTGSIGASSGIITDTISSRTNTGMNISSQAGVTLTLDSNQDDSQRYFIIANGDGTAEHYFGDTGEVWLNFGRSSEGDFQVRGDNDYALIFSDAGEDAVALGWASAGDSSPEWSDLTETGADVKILLSGTVGSKNGAVRGTILSAGDLVVSGNTHLHNELGIDQNKKIYFNGFSGDVFISSSDGNSLVIDGDDIVSVFGDTGVVLNAGSSNEFQVTSGETAVNASKNDHDFYVNSDASFGALFLDAADDSIILGATSFDSTPTASELVSKGYGADVKIMLSGTVGSKDTATRGAVLATGDMVISGNTHLHDELGIDSNKKIYFNGLGGDQFIYGGSGGHTLYIDGDNYIQNDADTRFDVNVSTTNQVKFAANYNAFNYAKNDVNFFVNGDTKDGILFVDASDESIILGAANLSAIPSADDLVNKGYGADVKIMLSGTIGSKDTATRGVVLVPGDMVISGALDVNTVSITTDGKLGIGTPNPSYKLEVGGNAAFGEYLYHRNNSGGQNTFMRFEDDKISFSAGNEVLLTLTEDAQDTVVIGHSSGDVDFQVKTLGDDNTLFVQGNTNRVGIGTDAPDSLLHLKELAPTFSIQRENNANDSTVAFLGAAGHTGAIMHLSNSNDLVFKTFDGSSTHEIMRLGGHYASDLRQVILLSGSGMAVSAMQPKNSLDINFFASGSINSKGNVTRGTAVFGGDTVISGTLYGEKGIAIDSQSIKNIFKVHDALDYVQIGGDGPSGQDTSLYVSGNLGGIQAGEGVSVFGGDVVVSGTLNLAGNNLKADGTQKKMHTKVLSWNSAINTNPTFPSGFGDGMGGSTTSPDTEHFITMFGSGSLKALDLWASEHGSGRQTGIEFYVNNASVAFAHCSGSFENSTIPGISGNRAHLLVDFTLSNFISGSTNFNPGDIITIALTKLGGSDLTKINGTLLYEVEDETIITKFPAGTLG